MMAELKIPPFTKGVKKFDVDWSHELSIVHIHIERIPVGNFSGDKLSRFY